jgi:oligopeptide/dipeptide ABC transporter ATP-binding protein
MLDVTKAAETLRVDGLSTRLDTRTGSVTVVDNLSYTLHAGEMLALVGESGSGKSMSALSIMRLLPENVGSIAGGTVMLAGQDLVRLSDREMRRVRGADIAMIFQEPMSSLNPVMTVGRQIEEVIAEHKPKLGRATRRTRVIELLAKVRIADPARIVDEYPHRLSGGMRQRVMIAMALACDPTVLIADEPTTALDATVQAQILSLLASMQKELGLSILLITHNLGVVGSYADRVLVMYAGRVVEEGTVSTVLSEPRHPYTKGLLAALPDIADDDGERRPLREIPGMVPPLNALPQGCAFAARCGERITRCDAERPVLEPTNGQHRAACFVAQSAVRASP